MARSVDADRCWSVRIEPRPLYAPVGKSDRSAFSGLGSERSAKASFHPVCDARRLMSGPARPSGDSFLVGGHQVEQFGRCELAVIAPFADLPHDTGLRECFEPLKGLLLTRPDRGADRRGR